MKKKNLLLTIALLTTMLLTGCNTGDSQSSESASVQESLAPVETPAPEVDHGIPHVSITGQTEYRYAGDEEAVLVEANIDKVTLSGEGYENAAKAVEKMFASHQAELDNLAMNAKDDYEYSKSSGDPYFSPYYISSTCEVARLDEYIFSMKRFDYEYFGGAHGNGVEWGTTIDLVTGEELELIDLAIDSYALVDICTNYVLEELATRSDELFPEYETYVSENLQNCNWYLDASGIQFVFTPYEIGPYASGNIVVCVPYSQVSTCMKPEYCGLHGSCIAMVQVDNKVDFVSGEYARTLVFEAQPFDEYEEQIVLKVDDEILPLEPYVGLDTAYIVRNKDSKVFLLYSIDWASDDYETYIYDLSDKNFTQTANIWAQLCGKNLSHNNISLRFTLQVLGTYHADMTYILNEDGTIEPTKDVYEIGSHVGRTGITTIKELPVTMDGVQTTLPVGTRLYITATDNEGTAWFETATEKGDFQTGEIHYVRDAESYQITIDGVSEYEYFENLPYAG